MASTPPPTSKNLVFVHGFMGGSGQWAQQEKDFAGDYRVCLLDLPGYGKRSHIKPLNSIEAYADWALQELTHQHIDEFYLLGHSMGGMIVQAMVKAAPQRIKRLIIYASAASGNLPNRFEPFSVSKQRAIDTGAKPNAKRIAATWFKDGEQDAAYPLCAELAQQAPLASQLAGLDAMQVWDNHKNLSSIPCPTLVIWGDCDRTYGWSTIETLWQTIPNCHLAVVPQAAHALHLENPTIFAQLIKQFLL